MSGGEVRRVSREDIQLVQNLIERCLQLYMNQKEVVETLLVQAKIEPGFTELVWQKLEEENREFFRAYHLRLIVKQQIMIFNKLLEEQVELMHKSQAGVASLPNSNGSHTSQLHQTSACYAPKHTGPPFRPENLHNPSGPALPNALINGGQAMHSRMNTVDSISAQTGRMEVPPNMLSTQSSHVGMIQGMNGIMIKSEPGYSSSSTFTFGPDGDVLETRPTIGDASVASFSSIESSSQPLHDPILDTDISSFGFLGQIPRNFSLSDLTADFSQSSDILESYSRSPYLASNTDNFLDSPERAECHGDSKKLDTISEGLSYEEFGSD